MKGVLRTSHSNFTHADPGLLVPYYNTPESVGSLISRLNMEFPAIIPIPAGVHDNLEYRDFNRVAS